MTLILVSKDIDVKEVTLLLLLFICLFGLRLPGDSFIVSPPIVISFAHIVLRVLTIVALCDNNDT